MLKKTVRVNKKKKKLSIVSVIYNYMLYVLIPDTFTEPVATRTIVGYFELENI